ncbi:MAG: T9SS type A sorting domain-containing protein [Candidatus Cloacimonetes bacterium]|nr:T9SS type A sorting domain-containing protein [Candidatus Cloacimonadota bacterium]
MKRYIVAVGLCLLVALLPAISVETASLRNFLFGSEPACAYDNWISHLAEGIASPNYNLYGPYDVQTNGFGDFRLPTATDLIYWNNMMDLFVAEDFDGAQGVLTANAAPFEIVQFNDTDTGRSYYMLREIPNLSYFDDNGTMAEYDDEWGAFTYGWGLFIYNPQGSKPIIITVPHPCDDFPTPAIGYEALNAWNARYLLINGAGREVRWTNDGSYTNSKSLSDALRNPVHPFNTVYKKFADTIRDQFGIREFSTQIHSYDWNRHQGYANCQISAGNPRPCPNLPIRDLSPLKRDLINAGQHLMIPANTVGIHRDVYLNDFYSVNYSTHDFTFSDGDNTYPVNDQVDLPAYTQNQHMLYTQAGTTDYDVYEPFFHLEMDELPNCYEETDNAYHWFYGWDVASQTWDMDGLFNHFIDYYGRWVHQLEPVLVDMFAMNDDQTPPAPQNLAGHNQSLNGVTLSWAKSSGFDFDSYEILYATEPIGTDNFQIFSRTNNNFLASPDCEMITVTNLANSNPYYFKIRARDKNNNYSDLSNEVNTILAPANVTSLYAFGLDNTVRLYWQVNGQTNNQGFKIYRRDAASNFTLVDSWLTNPDLSNSTAYSFEWWDLTAVNGNQYTYKISSTNTQDIEFFYNYPASAEPRAIHTITISNIPGTLSDQVFFSANPFATDGNDYYWDTTKAGPSDTPYVWNAFYEQYWSSGGTNLTREVKGDFDPAHQIKTWVLRTRSDQLETLNISATGGFNREEKLYLQDGGAYHNLLAGPYQFTNSNANARSMILHWGNMQPKVTVSALENMVYQGGSTINFAWNYQYPFLIDHVEISVINASDSLLLTDTVPPTQYSFSWMVPSNVNEMQDCRFVADVVAVDGVRSRFESSYRFALLPFMNLAYNEPGLKMRSNPWLNTDLSFDQVFGPAIAYQMTPDGGWGMVEDYDFGTAYWVNSNDISFYSNTAPLQGGTWFFDLIPGWNFIPNPHLCAYDLEDLSFTLAGQLYRFSEMISQELVSPAVFVWRGTDYEKVSRIEPWEAFLLYYNGSSDLLPQIRFQPFFNGPQLQAPPPAFKLRMELAGAHPAWIELGLHPLASDAVDFRFDHPRAPYPPIPNGSAIWLHQAADPSAAWNLCSEYRAPFSEPEQAEFYDLRLHAGTDAPRELSFTTEGAGDQWQILLMLNDVPYYLDGQDTITWLPPAVGTYEGYIRVSNYQVALQDLVQHPISALSAYPNPFNPDVSIAFNLALSNDVSVDVFNIRGQKVRSLYRGKLAGGNHSLRWDGRDDSGRGVASGVYFARVQTKEESKTIRMMLMK